MKGVWVVSMKVCRKSCRILWELIAAILERQWEVYGKSAVIARRIVSMSNTMQAQDMTRRAGRVSALPEGNTAAGRTGPELGP